MVRASLTSVGVKNWPVDISLIETSRSRSALRSVLVQSAWNVMPTPEFVTALAPYPARMKMVAAARRAVAQLQIRRAAEVVVLTHAMSELLAASTGRTPIVAEATAGLSGWSDTRLAAQPTDPGYALVVGTLSWFKQPQSAAALVRSRRPDLRRIVFAGADDGSGCWPATLARCREQGIDGQRVQVSHDEMYGLYRGASLCVLPSSLESLGFGLAEALLHSGNVLASPLPAHKEVASRVGREPAWIGDPTPISTNHRSPIIDEPTVRKQWQSVANALHLLP